MMMMMMMLKFCWCSWQLCTTTPPQLLKRTPAPSGSTGSTTPSASATPVTSSQGSPPLLMRDAMATHAPDLAVTLRGPASKRSSQGTSDLEPVPVAKRRGSLTAEEVTTSPWVAETKRGGQGVWPPMLWGWSGASGSAGWSSATVGTSSAAGTGGPVSAGNLSGSSGAPSGVAAAAVHPLLALPTRYAVC